MRFLTEPEAAAWMGDRGFAQSPSQLPSMPARSLPHLRVGVPTSPGGLLEFCRTVSRLLAPRSSCLLFVVTWGVWASSENWHLYYRLRQSYGDPRMLEEAPGHLFLGYEEVDFVSYMELALLSGWDAHVLPELEYGGPETARGFVSHDEWVLLAHREAETVAAWRSQLDAAGYALLAPLAA